MKSALICDAVRTPIGRYGGALAAVRTDDLAAQAIRALLERNAGLDANEIDEVVLGCANQAGEDNRNVARMALLLAGLPSSVPGSTINRLCGSGLDAVNIAARGIRTSEYAIAVAGGVESMSRAPFVIGKADGAYARSMHLEDTTMGWRFVNPLFKALYGTETMPETAENVAEQWNVSREDQDAFALRSQLRASAAQQAGRFNREIVPVTITGRKGAVTQVSRDEHPRGDVTLESLAKLPTPFRNPGTVTAGNASGINDGACALLLADADSAKYYGLTPRARVVACAVAGVEPRIMGIGPVPAVRKLLAKTGIGLDEIGVIELNEAFAAQSLACLRELGLPDDAEHVNPNGGAIALGHPLGMSGARLVTTAVNELEVRQTRYALCTMCIGVGQGIALLIERV
jgi:acetyl-CoA acyltransferase